MTMTKTMQCVFVNTEQPPKKVKRTGMFKYSKIGLEGKREFSELVEVIYPHPEAPDDAIVSVYEFWPVNIRIGLEATAQQCIDSVKGIVEISNHLYHPDKIEGK